MAIQHLQHAVKELVARLENGKQRLALRGNRPYARTRTHDPRRWETAVVLPPAEFTNAKKYGVVINTAYLEAAYELKGGIQFNPKLLGNKMRQVLQDAGVPYVDLAYAIRDKSNNVIESDQRISRKILATLTADVKMIADYLPLTTGVRPTLIGGYGPSDSHPYGGACVDVHFFQWYDLVAYEDAVTMARVSYADEYQRTSTAMGRPVQQLGQHVYEDVLHFTGVIAKMIQASGE